MWHRVIRLLNKISSEILLPVPICRHARAQTIFQITCNVNLNEIRSFVHFNTHRRVGGGVGIISELRVGHQYECTLSGGLPALPLRQSGDCIADNAEAREE